MYNIDFDLAKELIDKNIKRLNQKEIVNIEDALNRIIVDDFIAPMYNPPFDKSPLDGFALRHEDTIGLNKDNKKEFKIIDTVYAGDVSKLSLDENTAIRIMTGAKMPEASDCVIRLEDVENIDGAILVDKEFKKNENYCFKGEDINKGDFLIEKNTKLNAIHLGVLGSMGVSLVEVYKKPRIKIIVTGDEVTKHGLNLEDGKIFDTNGILISSRLKELGYESSVLNILKDDIEDLSKLIESSIDSTDLIITTGGVSVGDKDIISDVMDNIGAKKLFWRVKMKPGTPIMLSMIEDDNKTIVSLSGNPFAALVNFEVMVRDIMYKMYEDKSLLTRKVKAEIQNDFTKTSKVIRYLRCIYEDGKVFLPNNGKHASGMLISMVDCNALIEVEAGNQGLEKGDTVNVILL